MSSGVLFSAQNNDWQTKPLLKKEPSNSQSAAAKNMPKKQKTMPWYKKPAVKYGAGCLVSLLATVYAVTNYVDTEALVIVEPAKSEAENTSGNGVDVQVKKTDEASLCSIDKDATGDQTVNGTVIDDEEKTQKVDGVVPVEKNAILKNVGYVVGSAVVIVGAMLLGGIFGNGGVQQSNSNDAPVVNASASDGGLSENAVSDEESQRDNIE